MSQKSSKAGAGIAVGMGAGIAIGVGIGLRPLIILPSELPLA